MRAALYIYLPDQKGINQALWEHQQSSFSTAQYSIKRDLPLLMMKAATELPQFWYSGWLEVRLLNTSLSVCESFEYTSCPPKQNSKKAAKHKLDGTGTDIINHMSN